MITLYLEVNNIQVDLNIMDKFEYKVPENIKMTPEEFIKITGNPRERNTKQHALKASKRHLKAPHRAQFVVHIATLPTGEKYKLDGHARAFLWKANKLKSPDMLQVVNWPCQTLEEVVEFRLSFDSRHAVRPVGGRA